MKAPVGGGKKAAPKRKSAPIQKAYRPVSKTSGSRTPGFNKARATAARKSGNVGRGATARGSSKTRLKAQPYRGPNLNPMDALSAGLRSLGGVGDTIRQSNPVDALYDKIGNRIKEATRR